MTYSKIESVAERIWMGASIGFAVLYFVDYTPVFSGLFNLVGLVLELGLAVAAVSVFARITHQLTP